MHRFPTTHRRGIELAAMFALILALSLTALAHLQHRRDIADRAAILSDPLTTLSVPNHYGIEVADAQPTRGEGGDWKAYCYRERAALIAQAHASAIADR